jgi:hypothetical protein
MGRGAVFRMPGGGSLYPADGINNTAAFDRAGGTDTHEPVSVYFVSVLHGFEPLLQTRLGGAPIYSRCLANFSRPVPSCPRALHMHGRQLFQK